jgi:hypothetical protein
LGEDGEKKGKRKLKLEFFFKKTLS